MSRLVAEGVVLAGRWRVGARLGRGAMGEVWSAEDQETSARVAVKVPRPHALADAEWLARFARESAALPRLAAVTPHVCRGLAAGEWEGLPFLVLERLDGEPLAATLRREGALAAADVAWIGDQLLGALVATHRAGVLHRDLNPSNVFLVRGDDGAGLVKIIDFGLARDDASAPITGDDATLGTLAYVAPEQLGEAASADARSDVYAAASILFHTLAGAPPFGSARGARLVALKRSHDPPTLDEATGERFPAALVAFFRRALANARKARFPSTEVAHASFRSAAEGVAHTAVHAVSRTTLAAAAAAAVASARAEGTVTADPPAHGARRSRRR
jgi:serine/threonine-protein kinase